MLWVILVIVVIATIPIMRSSVVSDRVKRIAAAIAKAEGYYVPGSLPNRLNNPGSIKGPDGQLIRFDTAEAGWAALYKQVSLILSGHSRWYRPDMSIAEIAAIYTGGDKPDAWARIVAGDLGVTPGTPIDQVA
jgi:hypothetical protein